VTAGALAAMLGMAVGGSQGPVSARRGLPDYVPIYIFDDGWMWVRVLSNPFYRTADTALTIPSTKLGLYPVQTHAILALVAPSDADPPPPTRLQRLGYADPTPVRALLSGEAPTNIFDLHWHGHSIDDLLGRVWPLAVELVNDPNEAQYSMASGNIELPQVLPDYIWEFMAEREPSIERGPDALKAVWDTFKPIAYSLSSSSRAGEYHTYVVVRPSIELDIVFYPGGPNADRAWAIRDNTTREQLSWGKTFVEAMDKQPAPMHAGPILKKSAYDAMWDQVVLPGEPTLDVEAYVLVDAPHPALGPIDTFVAVARAQELL
jgi:hypothetical protein